ncbi:hypothetical protein [Kamptonema formosum]|uniref:hypothetical protein n=1 Tax=Kamptonema formosum TaxID=331992 RepID=UPI00034CF66D
MKGQIAAAAKQATDRDVVNTGFWVFLGVIIAPLTALIFGIFLTNALIQPLKGVVNPIANFSSQQLSLTAQQQAVAIQQVVEAMNAINTGAKEPASGISQTRAGTQNLNEVAQQLKAVV